MEFRLLGPVELWVEGRAAEIGRPQQRVVLAALAVDVGQVVAPDVLACRLWDEPTPKARRLLQTHLSRIKRLLTEAADDSVRLVHRAGGYLLETDPDRVDLHRFRRLLGQARDGACGLDEQVGLLRTALALWRGEPLAGLPGEWANRTREDLRQQHVNAVMAWASAELRLGNQDAVIEALTGLVAEHPLVEPLWAMLMRALHAAGRPGEAMAHFVQVRRRLAEELGVDPGVELRNLHAKILVGDPIEPAAGKENAAPPMELPPDSGVFVGRQAELSQIKVLLEASVSDAGHEVVVCISGVGGVGKSALAIHAAHRAKHGYPDGQLYVDLHGATAGLRPPEPGEVLDHWLRIIGAHADDLPTDSTHAAGMFRSLTARRRMLVVLDNAAGVQQVRPLLPAGHRCAVLITSRRSMPTLDGAVQLHLDPLTEQEAALLLGRLAGPDRVDRDLEAADRIVRLCGGLPLAVRIAGARLAARPEWQTHLLADQLADEQHRLDELRIDDLEVRTSLAASLQDLQATRPGELAAQMLALLGVIDISDIALPVAAALTAGPIRTARQALEELVDASLLEARPHSRYRRHDLVRLFSRELAHQNLSEPERHSALCRVLSTFLAAAVAAGGLLHPAARRRGDTKITASGGAGLPTTRAEAITWTDAEHANLVAAAHQGATTSTAGRRLTIDLAAALFWPFCIRGYLQELVTINELSVLAAQQDGDRRAEAQASCDLGDAHLRRERLDSADRYLTHALMIFRDLGDRAGEATTLNRLGLTSRRRHRPYAAIRQFRQSLAIRHQADDRIGVASVLTNLSLAYQDLHDFRQAIDALRNSLAISRVAGDRIAEGIALGHLADAYLKAGHSEQAIPHYQQSLAISQQTGDRYGEAQWLWELGQAHHSLGHTDTARKYWHDAIQILHELNAITSIEADDILATPVPDTPEPLKLR